MMKICMSLVLTGMFVRSVFAVGDVPSATWTVVSCTSAEDQKGSHPGIHAVDGKSETMWHSYFAERATAHPHELVIDLGKTLELTGFSYLPRQDGGQNGSVLTYGFDVGADGRTWREAAAGDFADSVKAGGEQRVAFEIKQPARYIRFRSLQAVGPRPITSVAELGVFTSSPIPRALAAVGRPRTYPVLLAAGDRSVLPDVERDRLIAFALYTVQKGVLKLSAHLYPLRESDAQGVSLEVERGGGWREIATAPVHKVGWTALFRIEQWDGARDVRYRVRHAGGSSYEGVIRRDPVDKSEIVTAVFTGNSPGPGGGKISKRDVVENVLKVDPDVLLFTGDQVYNHTQHTAHWLQFGTEFGDMMRDRPTICLPDDHDVGQPNLWGQGGRAAKVDTQGGYTRPAAYVQMVERQQTSHLPDPWDPAPVERGIGVYFTRLQVGGVDFAILEDRKFKSGCTAMGVTQRKLGPRADLLTKAGVDPKQFDADGLTLLGDRQLKFLRDWGQDWKGAKMKAAVSQTIFSMGMTHGGGKTRYMMDFDTDGWPQRGRDKAVDALRRCYAVHLCGDQHLSTIGQYGLDEFKDAGWWFCVPSIANLYPRWWAPEDKPVRKIDGPLDFLGDYFDGFANRVTVYAHTNPRRTGRQPAELHDRMPGWGLVTFDTAARTITMACWPRMTDPTDPKSKQYAGWPRTISQFDNYPRKAAAWLPTINVRGATDPVVQVVDEADGSVVYTVRILGRTFSPRVFQAGTYTVHVTAGEKAQVLKNLKSTEKKDEADVHVTL